MGRVVDLEGQLEMMSFESDALTTTRPRRVTRLRALVGSDDTPAGPNLQPIGRALLR